MSDIADLRHETLPRTFSMFNRK